MRQHINRRTNQNLMGNWGNWDWFRARDAMIFGAGALLSLAASRVAPPFAGRAIDSIRAMTGGVKARRRSSRTSALRPRRAIAMRQVGSSTPGALPPPT